MEIPGLDETLFSFWRLVLAVVPMFLVSLADLTVLPAFGVTTVTELVGRTLVYSFGAYAGLTLLAYTYPPTWPGGSEYEGDR